MTKNNFDCFLDTV